MDRSAYFHLTASEYNKFLFASVCDEHSGMPLNVVSVLARAGTDPWREASRLARLPRATAAKALAVMIGKGPVAGLTASETSSIAARLIELLPMTGRPWPNDAAKPPPRHESVARFWRWMILVSLIVLGLIVISIVSVVADSRPEAGAAGYTSTNSGNQIP